MALHNGPNARLPAGFPVPLSLCNLTVPSTALPTSHSTRKNAGQNTMAPCAYCMRDALVFVAPVLCGSSVKSILPPKNRVGSAPSFGLFLPILLPLPLRPFRRRHRCSRLLLSSGEIGLAALWVETSFSSCAEKPSRSPGCLPLRQSLPLSQTRPC